MMMKLEFKKIHLLFNKSQNNKTIRKVLLKVMERLHNSKPVINKKQQQRKRSGNNNQKLSGLY